ncbi:ketoacyl-ACP synthase III family protein [Kitasatospora terrestris]|uniref:Ketoacyl-ACP synthase III family protein n=1 Tax=Kitasatospora terrestris TaxID=258051 RepID=A0ABP9DKM5_9ACTN
MRWENVYVAGIGTYLPDETVTAAEAVADGRYDAANAEASGVRAVRVAADDEPGPVMAAKAGRLAIERAGVAAEDIDLVLHAYVGHQGQELWSPAHYVLNETVGGRAAAIELRQGCNGALAATELAASYLVARPDTTAALVTTGDAFKLPHIDRWSADDQTVYGDGGAAIVLSKRGGFARLLATATRSEPSLEPLYRGTEWTAAPFAEGKPVDLTARKDSWLMRNEDAYDDALALIGENFAEVLQEALADAGTTLAETQWFVHANVSRQIAEWGFHKALGLDVSTTPYEWGLDHGHMGNSDQFMGIDHLIAEGRPKAGDKLVTIGVGIGFMWTVAVLEFTETPAW